jgi:NADH dehydrogenase
MPQFIAGARSFRKTAITFPDHAQMRCTAPGGWRIAKPPNIPSILRIFPKEMDAMASNLDTLVTVFGGSGFLGRNVVRALAKREYRIRVAVRRPELAGHLQPLGRVGQIHAVQANLRYPASVEAAMRDSHVAINLVGILAESGAQTFDAVQDAGAGAVAKAAGAVDARMVHVSAIGADENSQSAYARSKAAGEKAVLAAVPSATILRPSVVFGPEDQFTNRFAALAKVSPMLPLIGGGMTKMQPVYVGDVATAVADAVEGKTRPGATYELGGPEVLSMREIIEIILATIDRERMLVSLPFGLAKLQALLLQFAPGPLKLTPDQVELLRSDNVVSDVAKAAGLTLEGLGIAADSLEAIAAQYLWRFRPAGQFQRKNA